MSRATTMNTYGVTLLEDVKYRSQSLCPTGVKVVNASLALPVPYESLKLTEVCETHHTPTEYFPPCCFLESTFHYLTQKLHCLPQIQLHFLLYSVGLAQ